MSTTQKTIIHFSQDFTKGKPQLGGYSRIFNLCSDSNNHIIYTISATISSIEEYMIDKIRVVQIPVKNRPSGVLNQIKLYKPIGKMICKHITACNIVPDLFFGHSHQGNFLILQYVKNKLFSSKKILWEANGIGGFPKVNKPFKQFLANRVQYQLQKYAFKKADTIIAQTLQSKEFITKEFSVSEQKINVVPNAIVVAKREKPKSPKKSSLIKILCFGLFDELNGIPFLIDVITKNKFSHIEFVFAGFGKYTKEVEMLASTRDNVTYLGQLPYKDMMAKLPEHEFLIIPRLNTLGAQLYIPTKLLEGMYMGVVPICSDVEGMTCVVDHDEDGLVFKAAEEDGLVKILNNLVSIDDEMYLKLRYHAQQKVSENYTWESNFEYLKQIYSKCIN